MDKFFTAGNILTIARLVLLPVIVAGIALDKGWLAVGAMGAALVTDLLDGRVSRKLGTASEFGRNLDSTIDFILLHLVFIAFYAAGRIFTYQFAIVYTAMLATLALNMLSSSVSEESGVVKTKFGKPVGAVEYGLLLLLVVREVAEKNQALGYVITALFAVLGVLVVLYIVECCSRIKGLVGKQ